MSPAAPLSWTATCRNCSGVTRMPIPFISHLSGMLRKQSLMKLYLRTQSKANEYPQGLPNASALGIRRERRPGEGAIGGDGSAGLSHRSPRSTTGPRTASAGRRRLPRWSPEGAQDVDEPSDPTSVRRSAVDRHRGSPGVLDLCQDRLVVDDRR